MKTPIMLMLCLLCFQSCGETSNSDVNEIRAMVNHLDRAVTPKMALSAGAQFPEGELFTYEFFGLALVNLAEQTQLPKDLDFAIQKGKWLLKQIDQSLQHKPFLQRRNLPARGGICWLGGRNLLLARLIRLAPSQMAEFIGEFHRESQTLHSVFMNEPSGVPETFPKRRWPVDALFALLSLQIHDEVYQTQLVKTPLARWLQTAKSHFDEQTGLMASEVDASGKSKDIPRGCALSWTLSVLPQLDAAFAAQQWKQYKKHYLRGFQGARGFREYAEGVERKSDVDSGPIINGIGMAATGFGVTAAKANGDAPLAHDIERLAEILALPKTDSRGKRYLGGRVPFFDVLVLWAKTQPVREVARTTQR